MNPMLIKTLMVPVIAGSVFFSNMPGLNKQQMQLPTAIREEAIEIGNSLLSKLPALREEVARLSLIKIPDPVDSWLNDHHNEIIGDVENLVIEEVAFRVHENLWDFDDDDEVTVIKELIHDYLPESIDRSVVYHEDQSITQRRTWFDKKYQFERKVTDTESKDIMNKVVNSVNEMINMGWSGR